MNRRCFLKKSVLTGAVLWGGGLAGCARDLRKTLMHLPEGSCDAGLSRDAYQMLFYASLAPSGHNSQPWFVRMENDTRWVVGSDRARWLPAVDPENREVLLSIGAFIENLVLAAGVLGYGAEVEIQARDRFDPDVARVTLFSQPAGKTPDQILAQMAARRTVKTGLEGTALKPADLTLLEQAVSGKLYYFPRGGSHSDCMARAAVENFQVQFDNMTAMAEAARWTRLSDDAAKQYRDGLTPDGMEISGLAGFWVRHFMDSGDVTGNLWREKALEKVTAQVREGAGWLVLTSPSGAVADLVEAGRRFQRLALAAVPLGIGIHPMTQTLEEAGGQRAVRTHHDPGMIPQFMLRVGYVHPYPPPVSLRRPPEWFVTG